MAIIETSDKAETGIAEFVLILLACLVLGFGVLIRMEIVKRLGMLSAVTAAIFAGLVIWMRP